MGTVLEPLPLTPLGYLKPWSMRAHIEPKKTYSGKIVYKRKPHFFTISDANRILSRLEKDDIIQEDKPIRFEWLEALLRGVFRAIFLIVPIPGVLKPFEQPFVDWYVGVTMDGFQFMTYNEYSRSVKLRTKQLFERCAGIFGDTVIDFMKQ